MFTPQETKRYTLSRTDPTHPLASYSKHSFELEGTVWPSVEHYFQAMQYQDEAYREQIRSAPHPNDAAKLGKSRRHGKRKDWDAIKETIMTRGVYIKCRTHPEVAEQLLATGDQPILETALYDYYWGCGRDQRGENTYGKVLMNVRDKLREEQNN